jgi:hypothetical protein
VLKTAIDQVVFAAAPDDTRPVLAGVLLRLDTGQLTLVNRTSGSGDHNVVHDRGIDYVRYVVLT